MEGSVENFDIVDEEPPMVTDQSADAINNVIETEEEPRKEEALKGSAERIIVESG
jgi:hypothetical protein